MPFYVQSRGSASASAASSRPPPSAAASAASSAAPPHNELLYAAAGPGADAGSVRFVRTATSCPPIAACRGWHALDTRAGRCAVAAAPAQAPIRLAIWDPLAAADLPGHIDLPAPALPLRPRSWNDALLCEDPPDAPFHVVLVGTDVEGTFACVYSSPEPATWTEPTYAPQHPGGGDHIDAVRAALVGDAIYFLCQTWTRVLYDPGTGAMSVVHLPPASQSQNERIALTTTEDGSLGFARMEG